MVRQEEGGDGYDPSTSTSSGLACRLRDRLNQGKVAMWSWTDQGLHTLVAVYTKSVEFSKGDDRDSTALVFQNVSASQSSA